MKKIKLTQNKYTLVDDEDFEHLSQWEWHYLKSQYAIRFECNKGKKRNIYMHRVILGAEKRQHCDHINRNGLDNRRENIRLCSMAQNMRNSKKFKNNKSGYKGVVKSGNKWNAKINVDKKRIDLGCFKKIEDAAEVYNEGAKKYHGAFTNY